jgi:hypothetical protein
MFGMSRPYGLCWLHALSPMIITSQQDAYCVGLASMLVKLVATAQYVVNWSRSKQPVFHQQVCVCTLKFIYVKWNGEGFRMHIITYGIEI